MSVRRVVRSDPKTGATKEFYLVDVVFMHPDGNSERVRKVSPVQSRRGAEEYERKVRAEILNPTPVSKEVPTFGDFVEKSWWPTYPAAAGNRATTIREKQIHLRVHLVPALGRLRLDEIRAETIDRFFASLRKKALAEKTVKNISTTLHRVLASAVEWELLDKLPRLPKVRVTEPAFDAFVRAEVEVLLAAARSPEDRALLLFALHTGARAGEQLAIEWGDIDFTNGFVVFRRSSTRGVVGPTKSGRVRRVPLTATLTEALKQHRHLKSALVFANADGSPMSLWQLHERLWATCRHAGLRKIRWHDLRHTYASMLVALGVPLRQVQEWLGHSTITMTLRHAHLAPGGNAALIRLLDERRYGNLTATEATTS